MKLAAVCLIASTR